MKTSRKFVQFIFGFLVVISGMHLNSFAQTRTREVNNQSQSWFSINSTARITQHFGMITDVHMRRKNFLTGPNFYFARIGANYWLKENIAVTLGYAQLWLAPARPGWHHYGKEKRIYQQIQLSVKIGKAGLLQRLRNEQRWQEKIADDRFINSYKFTNRVRYLWSMNIPVSNNPHYPSLVLSDELLIQFGKEIIYNTFDQNRAFIGIKQSISKSLSFDLGYMLVYQQKYSGYQYDKNHTLRLFFYYVPDYRKETKDQNIASP